MAVLAHVNTVDPVLLVIPIVGVEISLVTVMLDVAVQPFAPVTVTVYVPAAVMLAFADDPKLLLHE
jgi:hypothetical protein